MNVSKAIEQLQQALDSQGDVTVFLQTEQADPGPGMELAAVSVDDSTASGNAVFLVSKRVDDARKGVGDEDFPL